MVYYANAAYINYQEFRTAKKCQLKKTKIQR